MTENHNFPRRPPLAARSGRRDVLGAMVTAGLMVLASVRETGARWKERSRQRKTSKRRHKQLHVQTAETITTVQELPSTITEFGPCTADNRIAALCGREREKQIL